MLHLLLSKPYLIASAIGLSILGLTAIYWYFKQEVIRRRQAENLLRQQTERERLVNQIAQYIRRSLDLDEVLATGMTKI